MGCSLGLGLVHFWRELKSPDRLKSRLTVIQPYALSQIDMANSGRGRYGCVPILLGLSSSAARPGHTGGDGSYEFQSIDNSTVK